MFEAVMEKKAQMSERRFALLPAHTSRTGNNAPQPYLPLEYGQQEIKASVVR